MSTIDDIIRSLEKKGASVNNDYGLNGDNNKEQKWSNCKGKERVNRCKDGRKNYMLSSSKDKLCHICKKAKADAGFKTCTTCRRKNMEKSRLYKKDSSYDIRKSKGLCPRCGAVRDIGKTTCLNCLVSSKEIRDAKKEGEEYANATRAMHEDRKKKGLCLTCGAVIEASEVRCKKCISYFMKKYERGSK